MLKRFAVVCAFAAGAVVPCDAEAQLSSVSCTTYINAIFTNVTPTACSGFWFGNEVQGPTPSAAVLSGLQGIGFTGTQYSAKLEGSGNYWGGAGQNVIDFPTLLFGQTIIGIHWGGGVFNGIPNSPNGLGTAFFAFDAGNTGLDKITLSDTWKQSLSNAALYQTSNRMNVVPEPSTYALLATGLLGLFGVVRRRNAKA